VSTFLAIYFWGLFAFILFAIGLTAYAVMRLAKEGLFTAGSNRGWSERQGIRNAIGNKILIDSKYATLRNWLLATYSTCFALFIVLFIIVGIVE
jgi:hypothetical protein